MKRREARLLALVVVLTAFGIFALARWIRLDPNIASLLPSAGEGAALRTYLAAFNGADPGVVLVTGDDREAVERAALAVAEKARTLSSVAAVVDDGDAASARTTGEWLLLATPEERPELLAVLNEPRLTERLQGTRALLLSPGSSAVKGTLAKDPLRLGQLLVTIRAGRRPQAGAQGSSFASADGLSRLVFVLPQGNAFRSEDAKRFVGDLEQAAAAAGSAAPGAAVRASITGGHAIAAASEALIRRDLGVSSAASLGLGMVVFLLLFRSPRVLVAVVPPLLAGTILTTLTALFFPGGLSAVAVGFASVVLGVGADSGVHLYAATQRALRAGAADPPAEARREVGKPVLLAAVSAGGVFACLLFSSVDALRQLGLLAAGGEVVTALCLLAVTPALATWLERDRVDEERLAPAWLVSTSHTPARRGLVLLLLTAAPSLVLVGLGARREGPVVALRPAGLAPLEVYREVALRFGTETEAPTIALVPGATVAGARAAADAVYAALSAHPEAVRSLDGLTAFHPAPETYEARRRELAPALAGRGRALGQALAAAGLSERAFSLAIGSLEALPNGASAELSAAELGRYVQPGAPGSPALATVAYLSVKGQEQAAAELVRTSAPGAVPTGLATLEPSLAAALSRDLPRAGGAAFAFVALALAVALRRARHVAIALAVVVAEVSLVLLAMRAAGIPLHVYDALVLPVLLGVTLDEVLFVLGAVEHARTPEERVEALRREAPLVATTALTTAAGFAALGACQFEGLRHLGFVGAVGSIVGLFLAIVAVPALLPQAHGSRARGPTPR